MSTRLSEETLARLEAATARARLTNNGELYDCLSVDDMAALLAEVREARAAGRKPSGPEECAECSHPWADHLNGRGTCLHPSRGRIGVRICDCSGFGAALRTEASR